LQGSDGDSLFVLETPTGTQHVSGITGQVFSEGIFRLLGEWNPIDKEQHAGNSVGLEQPFDERDSSARLASASGHLQQHLPPSLLDLFADGLDAFLLIVTAGDLQVDRNGQDVPPKL